MQSDSSTLPKLGLIGDIHGDFRPIRNAITSLGLTNMSLIQVGDFGYSFAYLPQAEYKYARSLDEYNTSLANRKITLYVIRGNHDNPAYFDGRFMLSNLKLLPDYTVQEINGENFLFVGGATSLDRTRRKLGTEYWTNEVFDFRPDVIKNLEGINCVVTHNAPTSALDYKLSERRTDLVHLSRYDETLIEDVAREQNEIQQMFDMLKEKNTITNWYHGHFHYDNRVVVDGTIFQCCAVNTLVPHLITPKI